MSSYSHENKLIDFLPFEQTLAKAIAEVSHSTTESIHTESALTTLNIIKGDYHNKNYLEQVSMLILDLCKNTAQTFPTTGLLYLLDLLIYRTDTVLEQTLTEAYLSTISRQLHDFFSTQSFADQFAILNAIFCINAEETAPLQKIANVQEQLQHPLFSSTLEMLLMNPDQFSVNLALLWQYLSPESKQRIALKLDPKTTTQTLSVTQSHSSWYICNSSEQRLLNSLPKKDFIILTDDDGEALILLKFNGKPVGLVVRSFITDQDQLLPRGAWIQRTQDEREKLLKYKSEHNIARFPLKAVPGSWTFHRGLFRVTRHAETFSPQERSIFMPSILDKVTRVKQKHSLLYFEIPKNFRSLLRNIWDQ